MAGGVHENMQAWNAAEDALLRKAVSEHGTRWAVIVESGYLPNRSKDMMRHRWTRIQKGSQNQQLGVPIKKKIHGCRLCGAKARAGHPCPGRVSSKEVREEAAACEESMQGEQEGQGELETHKDDGLFMEFSYDTLLESFNPPPKTIPSISIPSPPEISRFDSLESIGWFWNSDGGEEGSLLCSPPRTSVELLASHTSSLNVSLDFTIDNWSDLPFPALDQSSFGMEHLDGIQFESVGVVCTRKVRFAFPADMQPPVRPAGPFRMPPRIHRINK